MSWADFLKNKEAKKKDPRELLSEPFLIKFTTEQMSFIEERALKECNSKSGIIRRSIRTYMLETQQQEKENS